MLYREIKLGANEHFTSESNSNLSNMNDFVKVKFRGRQLHFWEMCVLEFLQEIQTKKKPIPCVSLRFPSLQARQKVKGIS